MSRDTLSADTKASLRFAFSISSMLETQAVSVRETEEEVLAQLLSEDPGPLPVCPQFDAEFEACLASSITYL